MERSGGGDAPPKIAEQFIANMAFGYSGDQWGVAGGPALRAHLRSVEAVEFSRTSNLYGSLDNDDSYQWVGGLRTAVEQMAHRAPEVYLHNLRQSGEEKTVALREWLAVELQSRQFNPTWLREMQKSGYAGAREMSKEIEHLYGFQKTAAEHLDNAAWNTVLDVYVKDKYQLGLRRFFEQQNPHARQTLLARLLDVDRQKIYRFTPADRKMLLTEYARSVVRDGAACSAQICGNSVLRQHVADQLRAEGLGSAATKLESAFRRTLQKPLPAVTITKKTKLPDVRDFKITVVNWVRQLPVVWKVDAIPGWAWACIAGAYLTIIGVRLRMRRLQGIETLLNRPR